MVKFFESKKYLSNFFLKFKLFFRKDVCFKNLEGTEWIQIELPSTNGIVSCTNSGKNSLWIIDCFGDVFMRTGICRGNPCGKQWLSVTNDAIKCGFKQIGLGENTVWALDNEGNVFYRVGISENKPDGTNWTHIPGLMSNISVSFTDQVIILISKLQLIIKI